MAAPLLPAGVEFVDVLFEIFEGSGAPHFHGGGEFAVLNRKVAREHAIFAPPLLDMKLR